MIRASWTFRRLRRAAIAERQRRPRSWCLVEPLEARLVLAHLITVNSLDDVNNSQGVVTLRTAIGEAIADPGSTVAFAPALFASGPGTITLGSALPAIDADVSITGPGSATLTVAGGGSASNFSVFSVAAGATASLSGLTISDGYTTTADLGGGIDNSGTISLSKVVLSNNTAHVGSGGAIFNHGGSLIVADSTISANTAASDGAGIFSDGGSLNLTRTGITGGTSGRNGGAIYTHNGTAVINHSTIFQNTAVAAGGGIFSDLTPITISDTVISDNNADLAGGIRNGGGLTATSSTITGNTATTSGGGISNDNMPLTMTNSTISGNRAGTTGGGVDSVAGAVSLVNSTVSGNTAQVGGGIRNAGVLTLTNDTFANNRSYNDPGGALVNLGTTTLHNTLIAGNFTGGNTSPGDINGVVDPTSSYNLIGDGDNVTGITNGILGNQIGTGAALIDAKLGPLASNGGPTQTHALLQGSPAIDAGNSTISGVKVPTLDQRGGQRGQIGVDSGVTSDIGAYEATSSYLVTSTADTFERNDVGTIRGALSWSAANTNANPANAANPAPNTIRFDTTGTFQSPQTIQLAETLVIRGNAGPQVIEGPGAARLVILGNQGTGGFGVLVVESNIDARLSGVTLSGGQSNVGGGVINLGKLTVIQSTISGNVATSAGGAFYNHGTLTLVGSVVSGNSGRYSAGGIANYPASATLTVTNSIITGNEAGAGAGIENQGTATIIGSNIQGNRADAEGGGIMNRATMTIADSAITGNTAQNSAGGVWNSSLLTLTNTTIAGNTAQYGGGIQNYVSDLSLTNVTITDNRSTVNSGGGVQVTNGKVTIHNSLIAGNFTGETGTTPGDVSGAIVAASSFNLIGDGDHLTGISNGSQGNKIGTTAAPIDAKLSPLDDHGGPTATIALLAGSPAIDGGSATIAGATIPQFDQRGAIRGSAGLNAGAAVDIGAYEASSSFLVTTFDDSPGASGTLRTAVGWANVNSNANPANVPNPAPNTVLFDAAGIFALPQAIVLRGGPLVLNNTTTAESIIGTGATSLLISGDSTFRVFEVRSGTTATLSGLTVTGGRDDGANGGGIVNAGTLTIVNSAISGNSSSTGGGGIYNGYGTLTIKDSELVHNVANGSGGSIFTNRGSVTIVHSKLTGSTAASNGGAILNYKGDVTVTDSDFEGNGAQYGGAIHNNGSLSLTDSTLENNSAVSGGALSNAKTANVSGSTFSGNHANIYGAGIFSDGTLTLTNSTLFGNTTGTAGGGFFNQGTATLTNATVTANRSTNSAGGGVANTGSLALFNTLVARNFTEANSASPGDVAGALNPTSAFNLIGDGDNLTGITNGTQGNQLGTVASPIDPKLGLLADNGGPTQTVALLPTSPALGHGSTALAVDPVSNAPLPFDQRGDAFPRAVLGAVDIGAFETQILATTLDVDASSGVYGGTVTLHATLRGDDQPLAGKTIKFHLGALEVGSSVTNAEGDATLADVSLGTKGVGTFTDFITADFAASEGIPASRGASALTVTPRALTVTAGNRTKVYGAQVPTPTFTITGFVNGDTVSVVSGSPALTTTATPSSHVQPSPYAINVAAGTLASANYSFTTFVGGSLTITPAKLTVTANNTSKVFGQALPALTASYKGFLNGDTAASLNKPVAFTTDAKQFSVPGTYKITAKAASDPDYTITFVQGKLTVRQVGLMPDARHPGRSIMVVVGNQARKNDISVSLVSAGKSSVAPSAAAPSGSIRVTIGSKAFDAVSLAKLSELVVYGGPVDNTIRVAPSITLPVVLIGGAGKATLQGGGGNNVLVAGAGDSNLVGGAKRDLLIGGSGWSTMDGRGGGDIFIAGTTDFDRNLTALDAIMAEWTFSHGYSSRVANLKGTGTGSSFAARKNGKFFLTTGGAHPTLHLSTAKSAIKGSPQGDWVLQRK